MDPTICVAVTWHDSVAPAVPDPGPRFLRLGREVELEVEVEEEGEEEVEVAVEVATDGNETTDDDEEEYVGGGKLASLAAPSI